MSRIARLLRAHATCKPPCTNQPSDVSFGPDPTSGVPTEIVEELASVVSELPDRVRHSYAMTVKLLI